MKKICDFFWNWILKLIILKLERCKKREIINIWVYGIGEIMIREVDGSYFFDMCVVSYVSLIIRRCVWVLRE